MKIKRPDTAFSIQPGKNTKPVKRDDYRAWIKTLPCLCCKRKPVDAAHLSKEERRFGHLGRGQRVKASDRWVLPLCRLCHATQHDFGEDEFWDVQRGSYPHVACLVLWGLWSDLGEDAVEIATKLIMERQLG